MPIKARLTTKGFEEYLEKLAQAGKDIDRIAAEALTVGGSILLDGMQRRVPKDTQNLLKNLECTEPKQDGNLVYVEIGVSRRADANTARYANAQEFGSSSMPAQAYIRPTMDEDMGKAKREMKKVFEKEIGKIG